MRGVRVAAAALAATLVTACGVDVQDRPEILQLDPVTAAAPPSPADSRVQVRIYLVRDSRLTPVRRAAPGRTAPDVLPLLAAGPTAAESAAGLRSALPPRSLPGQPRVVRSAQAVDVTATPELARIGGPDQLLAAAQLVWTVTEPPGPGRVRVLVGDRQLELPTDRGLTRRPVGRGDYTSVAPR